MTRFDDLDRALTAYFDVEAAAPAPAGLLESAMTTTARRRPRPASLARLHAGGSPSTGRETTRTLLIAAALLALLLLVVGAALLGGGRNPNPLIADATEIPSASPAESPAGSPAELVAAAPVDQGLRATWLGNTPKLASLGNGGGPVQLTISNDGTRLAAANFAPGAEFDSTISAIAPNQFRAVLDTASGGCPEGAVGTYRWTLTDPGDLVGLTSIGDECASRGDALGRTWARSLANPTTVGAGYVDTMGAPFSVVLPDQTLAARTLPDMIEIGGTDGFSLMAFRNPQGFVDACSDKQARVPYQAGAKAFAEFLQHNKALRTVSREELTIDGNHAIHIVTVEKPGACAQVPADGLYLWTPKDCQCHFVGGHDSLYLIDEPNGDTLMLEVSPVDETNPVERQIIDSIRLPATIPGG